MPTSVSSRRGPRPPNRRKQRPGGSRYKRTQDCHGDLVRSAQTVGPSAEVNASQTCADRQQASLRQSLMAR